MNTTDADLDALLRRTRPDPEVSRDFHGGVWVRIAQRTAPSAPLAWLDRLAASLLRPRVALAGTAALILIAGTAGAFSGAAHARQAAQVRYLSSVAPGLVM